MTLREKLGMGITNMLAKSLLNRLVKSYLEDPEIFHEKDIQYKLNRLLDVLRVAGYEKTHDCYVQLTYLKHSLIRQRSDGMMSKTLTEETILPPPSKGEKWSKEQNAFYLFKDQRDPLVLTNLRNPYTEDFWERFSSKIEDGTEITVIAPICLLRMYDEKVL